MSKKKEVAEPVKSVAGTTALSTHDHYLTKKEVAKLIAKENGISFQQAFDSIEDGSIVSRNPKENFQALKKSK